MKRAVQSGPKSIKNINVRNNKVLVRVDFNLPIHGVKITDSSRVIAAKKTIDWLIKEGATVFLISHFGDANGKKDKNYSLRKILPFVKKTLGQKIIFVPDCVGKTRDEAILKSKKGQIYLLENTRFYFGEKENDPIFAKELARGYDYFVNEAFSSSHRAHASTVGITKYLPSYSGFNLTEECEALSSILENPKSPFVAVIGGAKISSKIDILKNLIEKVDVLIIGGGMANNFLAAEGYEIGRSFYEENFIDSAEEISRMAYDKAIEFLLPDDVLVAKKIGARARVQKKDIDQVSKGDVIADIGPKSVAKFIEPINFAGTIFWNGPLGISEFKPFSGATQALANVISKSKGRSIIGGGDTLASVKGKNLKFDFVSTGGGATLELVAGHKLPGIEALR
ncbi:MAG: phosphoglycerate kinase [Patescibacteria group bacterium]|nr:phosphoglycerate kinase [Patescibacteria group bacterium]